MTVQTLEVARCVQSDSRCAMLQLSEVQVAVAASLPGPDRDSLISLQSHIEELITLTRENLTGLQNQEKERDLLQTGATDQYDKEYALLKVSWKCEVISKPTNAHKHMTVLLYTFCAFYLFWPLMRPSSGMCTAKDVQNVHCKGHTGCALQRTYIIQVYS